jgi:hypothetical protein
MQYIVDDDDRKDVNSQTKNCMTNDTNCIDSENTHWILFIRIFWKKRRCTNNYAIYIK